MGPRRGPPGRRRRIFSMRFHDAGGHDLSGYRKKKGHRQRHSVVEIKEIKTA